MNIIVHRIMNSPQRLGERKSKAWHSKNRSGRYLLVKELDMNGRDTGLRSVCEGEGLGRRSRLCVRQAPLSEDLDHRSGPDPKKIRYADSDGIWGGIGSSFVLAKALVRGLPLLPPPLFRGCVGELPFLCTTGAGELCCSDWVWRERDRMPMNSTEAEHYGPQGRPIVCAGGTTYCREGG